VQAAGETRRLNYSIPSVLHRAASRRSECGASIIWAEVNGLPLNTLLGKPSDFH
jgi:hypothetical protein